MNDQIAEWMVAAAEDLRKKTLLDLGIQPPPVSDYPDGEAVMISNAAVLAKHVPLEVKSGQSACLTADLDEIDKALRIAQEALNALRSRLPATGSLGAPTQTTSQQTS
jgi:hypothetical protein